MSTDAQRKLAQFQRLVNVRLHQSGQRASATQRRIEALYAELLAAGVTNDEMRAK